MNHTAHLNNKIADVLGYDLYRVSNDANGNPRYVIHWLAFANEYDQAKNIANSLGFRVYRGKDFGGGFVCQSYSVQDTAKRIIAARSKGNNHDQ